MRSSSPRKLVRTPDDMELATTLTGTPVLRQARVHMQHSHIPTRIRGLQSACETGLFLRIYTSAARIVLARPRD